MTTRLGSAVQLVSRSRCRVWVSALLVLSLRVALAQSNVFDSPRQPAVSVPAAPPPAAGSGSASVGSVSALSAPVGYRLSANDQVAVEVFGEDDLRTNGRLNAEG